MYRNTLLIAIGICGLSLSSEAALLAHYKFDETSGSIATNSAENSDHGTINSGVTIGVSGISGNAYRFNGTASTGYVGVGNASFLSDITASRELTFSAWISTSNPAGGANRSAIVFAGNNTVSDRYTDLGTINANPPVGVTQYDAFARNRAAGNGINSYGGSSVADGEWHLLTMTIDLTAASGQLSLFVDGELVDSDDLAGADLNFPTFNNFAIGHLGRNSPVDAYAGLVDDVQVYSEALSASQVQWLFDNPGLSIPEPGALALAGLGLLSLFRRVRR